jgi:hypothetical protein
MLLYQALTNVSELDTSVCEVAGRVGCAEDADWEGPENFCFTEVKVRK